MVVDDDKTMNTLLKTLLELDGFAVVMASRGEAVLPLALAERPDALLMDVRIAEMDGLELLRELRRTPELEHLPVIMCSGMDLEQESQTAGANAFILKPYPPEQLTSTLKKVLV
jgi:CheY-like chemotaxis protein